MNDALSSSEEKEKEYIDKINALEETLKLKTHKCDNLEKQVLSLSDLAIKENNKVINNHKTQSFKLGKHDNILEFHIQKLVFDVPIFEKRKTFVSWTMPFSLDDPLQHTNLAVGTIALFKHTSIYKLQMNFHNLKSIHDDLVTGRHFSIFI